MTAALEGGEWSAARPGRTLSPGKTRYSFYRRLGGPQGRSWRAENFVPTGIRSRNFQPVVSRYKKGRSTLHKLKVIRTIILKWVVGMCGQKSSESEQGQSVETSECGSEFSAFTEREREEFVQYRGGCPFHSQGYISCMESVRQAVNVHISSYESTDGNSTTTSDVAPSMQMLSAPAFNSKTSSIQCWVLNIELCDQPRGLVVGVSDY